HTSDRPSSRPPRPAHVRRHRTGTYPVPAASRAQQQEGRSVLLAEYGQVDDSTYDSDDEGNGYPHAGRDPAGAAGPRPPDGGDGGPPGSEDEPMPAGRAARMDTELDELALRASGGD